MLQVAIAAPRPGNGPEEAARTGGVAAAAAWPTGSAIDQTARKAPRDPAAATGAQVPPKGASLGERFLNLADPGYLHVGDKWDVTINKGEQVRPLTGLDKVHYGFEEEKNPIAVFDAAWSAGYEQLRNAQPKFGSDSAGYGERLGAAAFRQGTYRLLGDGVFPAWLHEDPRYYRVADGGFWHRAAQSALQVLISHRDDGTRGPAYACFLGEATANSLPLTFYPHSGQKFRVAAMGFGFSLADDAALKLFREFAPDLAMKTKLIPSEK